MTNKKWREFWMKHMPGQMRDDLGSWCVCDKKCTCDSLSSKDIVHVVEIGALREAEELIGELVNRLECARGWGWLVTHAMQTYSRAAEKELVHIDSILKKHQAWKEGRTNALIEAHNKSTEG